jgi:hypothetical protein
MRAPRALFSLRTELLLSFALLTIAALVFAVGSVLLLSAALGRAHGVFYLSALIAADVCVLVAFGAYQVEREVMRPLRDAVDAAEAIANGDLRRRVPAGRSLEIQHLAASVNRMTDRLLEERAQLVRAEKLASIGRLAAGIAHEVGNPLGALTGYVHVLGARLRDRPELLDVVGGMERETVRIDRIVRGLLDYSRAQPAAAERVDLNEIVRAVVDLLTMQGVLRRVDVVLDLAAGPIAVSGDRHELEQVFVNLLLNATDSMHGAGRVTIRTEHMTRRALESADVHRSSDGGDVLVAHAPDPRVQVWLAKHATEDVVKVVVADAGEGIPVELRERVFDPFFTTKEPGKGTGLGLAIVARIIDNAAGAIWATSAREGGAAFHLLFPAAAAVRAGDITAGRTTAASR